MLRKLVPVFFLITFGAFHLYAQETEEISPVKWTLKADKFSRPLSKDDSFNASLSAEIDKGWHIYALEKIEDGPIPTRIFIPEGQPFELGKIGFPEPVEIDDPAFGVATKFYEDAVTFTLPIKILRAIEPGAAAKLQIKVRFQTCNDRMCLPPKTAVVEAELAYSQSASPA